MMSSVGASGTAAVVSAPPQAAAAGYRSLTFSTVSSFNARTVDQKLTYAPGYQWYYFNWVGAKPQPTITTLNTDGSATLSVFTSYYNAAIATAAQIPTAPYYRGTAFGGGAYFEATLAFDAATVNVNTGWPSAWTYPVEQLTKGAQWTGQASGYDHFVEPDIFEYNQAQWYPNAYFGSIHDWYGLYNKTCANTFCEVSSNWNTSVKSVPAGTNFRAYHRYGLLWVPATATRKGSVTYYFDGMQMGPAIPYTPFNNQAPVPTTSTPWTFAVMDKQHFMFILGTGSSTPMQVQSVTVWQANGNNNLHN